MRHWLPANIPLAIVIFAVAAAVALRAADRRAATRGTPGAKAALVTAAAEDGWPDGSGLQMQYVFHELHADGRHALCEVCNN
jgi:hypothetical protein